MIGKKLKSLLLEKEMTQKELAKLMDITPQAVSLWIKDKADPDILNLKLIAKIFEITVDELLEIEDEAGRKIYKIKNDFRNNNGIINQNNNY